MLFPKVKKPTVKFLCLLCMLGTSELLISCSSESSPKNNISVEKNVSSSTPTVQNSLVVQAKELQVGSEKVGVDNLKAIELLKKAVDAGDPEAMYLLSEYYKNRINVSYLPVNMNTRNDLLLKSAKLGNWKAMQELLNDERIENLFLLTTGNKAKFEKLKPIIEDGIKRKDPQAFIVMSDLLEKPGQDDFNAEQCKWLYEGYKLGDIEVAGYRLTSCSDSVLQELKAPLRNELRTIVDNYIGEKIKEYEQLQNPSLEQSIGVFGYHSAVESNKKVKERIIQKYLQQGEQGHSDAYLQIIAYNGSDNKENEVWYEKAAKLNNPVALTILGEAYLFPEDEKKKPNIKLGLEYLKRAAEQNNADAMNYLAVWYNENGKTSKDQDNVKQWLEKAAELGLLDAMQNAAFVLDEPRNYYWATVAFDNGTKNEDVLLMAEKAYIEGIGVHKNQKMADTVKKYIEQLKENDKAVSKAFGL